MQPDNPQELEQRLVAMIGQLENYTAQLRKDLQTMRQYLQNPGFPAEAGAAKFQMSSVEKQLTQTAVQLEANDRLLNELRSQKGASEKSEKLVSRLEQETVAMLERMQQKVNAAEILAGLYAGGKESMSDAGAQQSADPAADPVQPEPEPSKPKQAETDWKAIQDMEQAVDKLKKQEALEALKRKLKG